MAAIHAENFNSTQTGVIGVAVADMNIAESPARFAAELDGRTQAAQAAIAYANVATRRAGGGFEADAVIFGIDVAVHNADQLGRVNIDSVVVIICMIINSYMTNKNGPAMVKV